MSINTISLKQLSSCTSTKHSLTSYLGQGCRPRRPTTHGPGITRASLSAVKTEAPNWERGEAPGDRHLRAGESFWKAHV